MVGNPVVVEDLEAQQAPGQDKSDTKSNGRRGNRGSIMLCASWTICVRIDGGFSFLHLRANTFDHYKASVLVEEG